MPISPSQLSAAAVDAYLRKKGSPLVGQGAAFVSAGSQFGVDPRLLVGIAGAETSLATNRAAGRDITSGHNPFGMGPHIQYPSWEAGIQATARNLGQNYIGQGLQTIQQIATKWLGPGDNAAHWAANVGQYYRELGGDPAASAETQQYVQRAAQLEQAYQSTNQSFPEMMAASPASQLMRAPETTPLAPVKSLGQISQGVADRAEVAPRVHYDRGSNLLVQQFLDQRTKSMMADTAAQGGLTLEIDHNEPMAAAAPEIVRSAVSYLGTPYVWGGESPKGFDCSGFAQYLYHQQGIDLPRTTYDQVKVGVQVSRDNLEAGDLVFFRAGPKGPEHEGIYIGSGQFIHAPHTGDVVKISSMGDAYYKQNFVTARRVQAVPQGRGKGKS